MKTVLDDIIAFGHFTLIFFGELLGASTNKIPYEKQLLKCRFAPVCPSSRLDPFSSGFDFYAFSELQASVPIRGAHF